MPGSGNPESATAKDSSFTVLDTIDSVLLKYSDIFRYPGADSGFPIGGGVNPRAGGGGGGGGRGGGGAGAPTHDFAKFCKKMHEIENTFGIFCTFF